MSRQEMKKVLVVEKIMNGHMTNNEGAIALGITVRQIIRLKRRYETEGAQGITHKNRGRKPAHALSEEIM
ncbi:helix-turn-helix domain-containing protein, partial [Paenibacillus popilliae]|uniref:helix-turn-helix domain-containing protein n=1 Tax=Paenibacillus popilliae TaxID=78057 RepID=UPI0011D280A9